MLSLKATRPEHAGIMELKGVLLSRRWVFRPARRHSKRLVLLIDAKAALCAVAKGRTNAPAFHKTLCSIDALLLATNTLLRPVYIPSEDNPADALSRGRRRRPTTRRVFKKPGCSKVDHRLRRELLEEMRTSLLADELLRRNRPTPTRVLKASIRARGDARPFF